LFVSDKQLYALNALIEALDQVGRGNLVLCRRNITIVRNVQKLVPSYFQVVPVSLMLMSCGFPPSMVRLYRWSFLLTVVMFGSVSRRSAMSFSVGVKPKFSLALLEGKRLALA
jgi:hypothetical protein